MLGVGDIVIFSFGLFILVLYLLFFFAGYKYRTMFDVLDEKEYPFKEIYFVGYAIMQAVHYQYRSANDRKLRKELEILYDEKYSDYYLCVIYSQKVTITFSILALVAPLYGLSGEVIILLVLFLFAGVAWYYFGTTTSQKILKRSEEMLHDFSEVISKLALLTGAGMTLRDAWREVAYTRDSLLYLEMQLAVDQMNNGVAEIDAINQFGMRCIIAEIKKFTSTIVQGLVKGNSELASMLKEQNSQVWNEKKQNARREGEKAASKLLIPMFIMFAGILIMIIIPIFANLGA